jgi:hypothetical protein
MQPEVFNKHTSRAVFTTIHFLHKLQMGTLSWTLLEALAGTNALAFGPIKLQKNEVL